MRSKNNKDICVFKFLPVKVLWLHMPINWPKNNNFLSETFFWLSIGPFLHTLPRVLLALCKQKPHRRQNVSGTSHSVASCLLAAEFDTGERRGVNRHVTWRTGHVTTSCSLGCSLTDWQMKKSKINVALCLRQQSLSLHVPYLLLYFFTRKLLVPLATK